MSGTGRVRAAAGRPAAHRPPAGHRHRESRPPHTTPVPRSTPSSFGTGSLSRAAALIHTLVTVEALLLVAASPGLAGLLLLGPAPANLPLAAVCLLPLGPATAAALYALDRRDRDLTDLHPARSYWRGWRLNAVPALKLWTPLLAWLTIIAFTLTHFAATGLPGWWAMLLAAIGAGSLLWGAHALVLTALFAFRARDTARLAGHFLFRHGRTTLGAASLLVLTATGTAVLTEALPALLAAPMLLSLLHSSRPVITETREDFTA
ncbi:putative membrane protein YesL [Streptomyces sp. SAI-041]|nr:putative membrane protein YesL [Streptomyces sp. SAI-041]